MTPRQLVKELCREIMGATDAQLIDGEGWADSAFKKSERAAVDQEIPEAELPAARTYFRAKILLWLKDWNENEDKYMSEFKDRFNKG